MESVPRTYAVAERTEMPDLNTLTPKDHAEEIAIFRSEIVGALTRRELDHGQLRESLVTLAAQRYRPPKAHGTRQYAVSTLERWYYAYQKGGLSSLRPERRSDAGRAQDLTEAQRKLLCDIRREHPSASVSLILRTLVGDGRLGKDAVSAATIRRLFAEHGLVASRCATGPDRKRGCAGRPSAPGRCGTGTCATDRRSSSTGSRSRCGSTVSSTTPRAS